MDRPPFLNAFVPVADRGYEQIYPVTIPNVDAYQLINTAIWYTLARLSPGYNSIVNGVEGGTCYYIGTANVHIQLFVLRLSAHAVIVRVFPLYPADPIEGIIWKQHTTHEQIANALAPVYTQCQLEIRRFLRDAAQAENYDPPRPKSNNWEDRLNWLDTYHVHRSAEDQAKLLNVSVKTLQNQRSMLDRQKLHRIHGDNWELSGT